MKISKKNDKKVKVIVATHKKYLMPDDELYLPVHVGAEGKSSLGYQKDNEGDNIALKNPCFCELTGLYWAWKNLKVDYIGLCHYRRYFTLSKKYYKNEKEKFEHVLTKKEVEPLLENNDIILPKKRHYYIETLYSHYKHTMHIETLELAGDILKEMYPKYTLEFEKLKKRTSGHMFNMFIMKKEIFDDYCKWLFDILFELEKRIDYTKYDSFHARFFGRVSERLLDVYIRTNNLTYKEVRLMDMQNINWIKKGFSFLKAKFFGKKYDKSF